MSRLSTKSLFYQYSVIKDIDIVLSEDERLPCKFTSDCAHLGFLDPLSTSNDNVLPKSFRTELPIWLAETLSNSNFVEIEIPKHYGPKMRDELNSSSTINLRDFSHYFFDVGLKLSHMTKDEDLQRTIRTSFSGERFKTLAAHSLTNYHDDIAEYTQTLTRTELSVFQGGFSVSKDLIKWRNRQSNRLEAAPILSKKMILKDNDKSTENALKRNRID